MTEQEFSARVERLQQRSIRSPGLFRLQVILLMLCGYAAVVGMVGLALICGAGMLLLCIVHPIFLVKLFKILWLPVVFVWDVLRSLFVRFDAPAGLDITQQDLPALREAVESVRTSTGGIVLDRVLLTRDFNAGVMQLPRFGLLGGNRNYLVLGFPLLSTLDMAQFRSVLAHEFGHLSAGDSRLAGRIYRMRLAWGLLHQRFSQVKGGGYMLRRFMGWYWPRFNAFAFVLSRQQEYAADQMAARVSGAQATGEALILTNVAAVHQSEHFWSPLYKRADVQAEPAAAPFSHLLASPQLPGEAEGFQTLLDQVMARGTSASDTHPSLGDRLRALGQSPSVVLSPASTAAQVLFGDSAAALAESLDLEWLAEVKPRWQARFAEMEAGRAQLAELEASVEPLGEKQQVSLACLVEKIRGKDSARPLYESLYQRFPENADACFYWGRVLIGEKEATALPLLDKAMSLNVGITKPASELAYHFLMSQDRRDEAAVYERCWHARNQLEQAAQHERRYFSGADIYIPAKVPEAEVARIMAVLSKTERVGKVYLVQKHLKHMPEQPMHLLLIVPTLLLWGGEGWKTLTQRWVEMLALPEGIALVVYRSDIKKLRRAVAQVRDGRLRG